MTFQYLEMKLDDLEKRIEALEQEPCDDAISRQAVLDAIDKYTEKAQSTGTRDDFYSFEELVVKQLPPVQPKARMGRWEILPKSKYDSSTKDHIKCTNCGKEPFGDIPYMFCPNCGADMRGENK